MAPQHIEDTFTPETPTEVALLDRIRVLRRKLWEGSRWYNTADMMPPDPNAQIVEVKDFSPTLRLAGTSQVSLDIPRGLRIEARTKGPTSFGVANYISLMELQQMRPEQEARLLTHLHDKVVRQTGKLLREQFFQEAA